MSTLSCIGERKDKGVYLLKQEYRVYKFTYALFSTLSKVNHLVEISQDFWLCLDPQFLSYIDIGTNQTVGPAIDKTHGDWGQSKLPLEDFQGVGTWLVAKTFNLGTSPYSEAC